MVPPSIVLQDQTENVVSFNNKCKNGSLLTSDFPPRAGNRNHLECHKCQGMISNCAYNFFKHSNKSVVKLYSIWPMTLLKISVVYWKSWVLANSMNDEIICSGFELLIVILLRIEAIQHLHINTLDINTVTRIPWNEWLTIGETHFAINDRNKMEWMTFHNKHQSKREVTTYS